MKQSKKYLLLVLIGALSAVSAVAQTNALSVYVKRIEGSGNMARTLDFKEGMHDTLFVTGTNRIFQPIYDFNAAPVRVEVLDSTLIPASEMYIVLDDVSENSEWYMYPEGSSEIVYSSSTITVGDEQLIPQWGLLVQVKQAQLWEEDCDFILDCSIEESADPWLTWLHDTDQFGHYSNWIRSGSFDGVSTGYLDDIYASHQYDDLPSANPNSTTFFDENENFANMFGKEFS